MKYLLFILMVVFISSSHAQGNNISAGSKSFTESVILGEIAAQLISTVTDNVNHRRELGGSRFLWNALINGDIDIYPDYSGTIAHELLQKPDLSTEAELRSALKEHNIQMTDSLGFSNNYAIAMKEERAEELQISKISDLNNHPNLRFGFSNEFMDRQDGWPNLQESYSLPKENVDGLQHDLAYRGLENGSIDVTDVYTTDAEITQYNLRLLEDDQDYFPEYFAVYLYRNSLESKHPNIVSSVKRLEGIISEKQMREMNRLVENKGHNESQVASDFLLNKFQIKQQVDYESSQSNLWRRTKEHIFLVGISLSAAIIIAIPLGIAAFKISKLGQIILGAVGIIQTIPALALLVLMIPLLGIGTTPAIAALFLYSLLPIVRNTYSGLQDISTDLRESAQVLGLPPKNILWKIELPLALRSILAGIKTSAVYNIGFATLGALIGAGGYGQPILTGIRLDDIGLIFQGAIPAAILALMAQFLFELIERWMLPKGIKYDQN